MRVYANVSFKNSLERLLEQVSHPQWRWELEHLLLERFKDHLNTTIKGLISLKQILFIHNKYLLKAHYYLKAP